jgi:hypothetical protein
MSGGGAGLAKLTEYLNQTRRQAEASIDVLNTKIQALTEENEKLAGERDQYRRYAEQLQTEGSKKSRFQERDDWKALLDSVQRDRSRLQDECARLAGELEQARAEATVLEQELHHAQGTGAHDGGGDTTGTRGDGAGTGVGNDALSSSSAGAGDAAAGAGSPRSRGLGGPRGLTVDVPDAVAFFSTPGPGQGQAGASSPPSRPSRKSSFDGGQQPYPPPNAGLGPGAPPPQPSSPRAVSTRLQIELQRALAQLESERQTHADEKAALQVVHLYCLRRPPVCRIHPTTCQLTCPPAVCAV